MSHTAETFTASAESPTEVTVNAADEDLLAARLEVYDVKALFLELRDRGAPIHQGLRTEPWGQLTFVVRDPDRNLISFGSPMP